MIFLVTAIYCSDPAPSTDCTTVTVHARPTLMEPESIRCEAAG